MVASQPLPEITTTGVWSASSTKHGLGITNLYDSNIETFWQSDGKQPHSISVQFPTRQHVHSLSLYLDIDKDESYTPCKICILSGTSQRDMQLLQETEFASEPRGWIDFALSDVDGPLMAHYLRIELPLNYENGRDVRVRQIRILGPPASEQQFRANQTLPFTSPEFFMFDTIR
ncbi:hypothetical protein H4R20_001982 [Coemansia guatemalensis]|uniref:Anaphase-promoting complex subunit 10 n=1 Tax=Coemansia guatemalensis TaxID=2761395 RepID=A0A9W8LSR2_9FUNG|nr:hypothetical protein H4R20_001982 [Coemansia guatemalensis]